MIEIPQRDAWRIILGPLYDYLGPYLPLNYDTLAFPEYFLSNAYMLHI